MLKYIKHAPTTAWSHSRIHHIQQPGQWTYTAKLDAVALLLDGGEQSGLGWWPFTECSYFNPKYSIFLKLCLNLTKL